MSDVRIPTLKAIYEKLRTAFHSTYRAPTRSERMPRRSLVTTSTTQRHSPRSKVTLPALCLAVFSFLLTQTLVVPVLPSLAAALSIGPTAVGWIVTTNLLFGAVFVPILGVLGDRFGHRTVLLSAIAVMTAAALVAALSTNFATLLAARAVQAVGTGTFPLALTIVQFNYADKSQRSAMGWLSGVLGLGSAVSLLSGGVITDLFGWRGLFGTMALSGAIAWIGCYFFVPRTSRPSKSRKPIDWLGTTVFVIALSALLLGISQGNSFGWLSPQIATAFAVATIGACALVVIELRTAAPLLDVRLLVKGNLGLINALAFLIGFISFLFYIAVPIILLGTEHAGGMGLPLVEATLYMVPNALAVFIGGRLAANLVHRFGERATAILSMIFLACGAVVMAVGHSSVWAIAVAYVAVGAGIGIGFSCCSQFVPTLVDSAHIATALGINTMVRTVGQASGTPVATAFLTGVAVTDASVPTSATFFSLFMFATAMSTLGACMCILIRTTKRRSCDGHLDTKAIVHEPEKQVPARRTIQ